MPKAKTLSYQRYCQSIVKKLKHPQRIVIQQRNNALIYLSHNPDGMTFDASGSWTAVNNNMKFKDKHGQLIVCRHLALAWLFHDKCWFKPKQRYTTPYQSLFRSQASILQEPLLSNNAVDNNPQLGLATKGRFIFQGNSTTLGAILASLCKGLQLKQRKYFYLTNLKIHAVSIIVEYKYTNTYVVKLFDPNATLLHFRAVCHGRKGLRSLQFCDFFSLSVLNAYKFNNTLCCIDEIDPNNRQLKPLKHTESDFRYISSSNKPLNRVVALTFEYVMVAKIPKLNETIKTSKRNRLFSAANKQSPSTKLQLLQIWSHPTQGIYHWALKQQHLKIIEYITDLFAKLAQQDNTPAQQYILYTIGSVLKQSYLDYNATRDVINAHQADSSRPSM